MLGLAGLGVALITGTGMRIAAFAGAIPLVLMWSVVLPPENNLFMDDHLIYAGVLAGLALINAGDTAAVGAWWKNTKLVKRLPWLR